MSNTNKLVFTALVITKISHINDGGMDATIKEHEQNIQEKREAISDPNKRDHFAHEYISFSLEDSLSESHILTRINATVSEIVE